MRNSKAIDAAAWLAVQDCRKYGIPFKVLAPPYQSGPPGISDHKFVTEILRDGTHSDVGPNFPWPYFASKVAEYSGTAKPPKPEPPKPEWPKAATDRELLEDVWRRLSKLVPN